MCLELRGTPGSQYYGVVVLALLFYITFIPFGISFMLCCMGSTLPTLSRCSMHGRGRNHGVGYSGSRHSTDCVKSQKVFVLFVLVSLWLHLKFNQPLGLSCVQNRYLLIVYMIWLTVGMYSKCQLGPTYSNCLTTANHWWSHQKKGKKLFHCLFDCYDYLFTLYNPSPNLYNFVMIFVVFHPFSFH